ncbi:lauroyl acyltransferase [Desulfomarina profundi]|uniref:Lauroyl acyltransferase n=1 Tax=Desulfomarina profundi TaxID=2772557 RepID=A0A8D5JQJ2_9BACT|nr:lipid-A-disaccharide synthase N-terminal domain-containing protein [Desulfomarina profundi]BCL62495.1 lauroyl acyltransferase [Desulfomarina profundi]
MNQYFIFSIGFLSQLLFSARLLVQWISSEKAGRILSPLLFWQLSILASFLMMVYGILRNDLAIITGQAITYGVYIRNLHYHGFWKNIPTPVRFFAICFPILAIVWLLSGDSYNFQTILSNNDISRPLMMWGVASQFVFTFRFVFQWIYTERKKESLLPVGFWVISFTGSIMVLSYAIIRRDPVLFIGQIFGFVVYSRNIILWAKGKKQAIHRNEK